MRALLIREYNFSHSSGLRERNMMFALVRSTELVVGGDRIEMSRAVPLLRGTKGVSSSATKGLTPRWEGLACGPSPPMGAFAAWARSKASIRPGETMMVHSSLAGWLVEVQIDTVTVTPNPMVLSYRRRQLRSPIWVAVACSLVY